MKQEKTMNYKNKTVKELKVLCKERGIKGYSKLRKADLLEKLSAQEDKLKASEVAPVNQVEIKYLRNILESFARNNELPSNLSKIEFRTYGPGELKCQFFQSAEDEVPEEEIFILNFVGSKEGVVNSCNIEIDYSDVFEGFTNEELKYINGMQVAAGLLTLPPIDRDEEIERLRSENKALKAKLKASEVVLVKTVSAKEIENGLSIEKINDTVLWCLANSEQPAAVIVASFILNKENRELYEPRAGQFLEMDKQRQELVKQILHTKSDIVESVKPDVISALVDTFGKITTYRVKKEQEDLF